jgi:hypothetical protein
VTPIANKISGTTSPELIGVTTFLRGFVVSNRCSQV